MRKHNENRREIFKVNGFKIKLDSNKDYVIQNE